MRVLHILNHSLPLHSGYVFRTQGILTELRTLGITTYQMTGSKHPHCSSPTEEVGDFTFHRTNRATGAVDRLPGGGQLATITSLVGRLQTVVDETRPDILHAHSPCLNGLAALLVARRRKIPLVYEMRATWEDAAVSHGTTQEASVRYNLSRALETFTLRQADHVVVICDGLRKEVESRGIAADRVSVVANAVDRALVDAGRDGVVRSRPAGLPLNRRFIGFFGSLYSYEGLTLLIEAVAKLTEDVKDVVLLLIGSGPDEEHLRRRTRDLRIEDRVLFLGRVEHAYIAGYYQVVDALVFPRVSMRLTDLVTPLKPLEAMVARRIVVASDVGGHQELVEDGRTGLLFRAGDVGALVESLRHVFSDSEDISLITDRAYKHVMAERTWPNVAKNYLPIYHKLTV